MIANTEFLPEYPGLRSNYWVFGTGMNENTEIPWCRCLNARFFYFKACRHAEVFSLKSQYGQ